MNNLDKIMKKTKLTKREMESVIEGLKYLGLYFSDDDIIELCKDKSIIIDRSIDEFDVCFDYGKGRTVTMNIDTLKKFNSDI